MGTVFELFLVGDDREYLRDAAAEALEAVVQVEAQLSHYRPDSDIVDLNLRASFGPVRVEPTLFRLIAHLVRLSTSTGGAFDFTMGPLIRCWGFFRGTGSLPDPAALREALRRVGSSRLCVNEEEYTVRFPEEGMELHLGGVGKGCGVDAAVEVLRRLRIEGALVHGGTSTVYALGSAPGQAGWVVGLCDPEDRERRLGVVRLRDAALSTSGDYEQFFEMGGRRFSHILDPRSGWPAEGVRSATVLAPNATDSDALSTAAFVLGEREVRRQWATWPATAALFVTEPVDGGNHEVATLGVLDWIRDCGSANVG
jgi:thiamine biosynthesis lipoprotein